MAATKKYAGLPDVDEGVEIYETSVPELTEASTLPTESNADSEEYNPNLARDALDPDAARQRFGPSRVDARNVNFSDTIDGGRRDYRMRSRRRRKRGEVVEVDSDECEEETLQGRLARLRRETAELQAEIERIEQHKDDDDNSTYEDADDQHIPSGDLSRGVDQLSKQLDDVSLEKRKKGQTLEEEFTSRLNQDSTPSRAKQKPIAEGEALPQSSISAIADFSDRLTALEAALGVSTLEPIASTSSVLPTLETLTTQIETLSAALTPRTEGSQSTTTATSTIHLDPVAQKIRHLITESKRLEDSRRAAIKSFEELLETRDRHAHLVPHSHSAVHSGTETRLTRNMSSQEVITNGTAPGSGQAMNKQDMQQQFTTLFLDDQASRITALYNLLPTLHSLQPLLPVVLERLRALSVIHTGAAEVRSELDDVERRLQVQEEDVEKWRDAVTKAEAAMKEGKEVLRENVAEVGGIVKGLEHRIAKLGK